MLSAALINSSIYPPVGVIHAFIPHPSNINRQPRGCLFASPPPHLIEVIQFPVVQCDRSILSHAFELTEEMF